MTDSAPDCCLKVDVDTHDGMRYGVPRLLDAFEKSGVKATFFLSFGPDNSGNAIWNVFRQKGFLKKMLKTGAPGMYGWRTMLSGTLLPARMIALEFPDIVRSIAAEGHEVGVHAWDHRLWQDHLHRLSRNAIKEQYHKARAAYERILGMPPKSAAAPAWCMNKTALEIQDSLGLLYASDMRGGQPCSIELDGYHSRTLQVPTTQPCLEELYTLGNRDEEDNLQKIVSPPEEGGNMVIPLHAEVEGGVHISFLHKLLETIHTSGVRVRTMMDVANEFHARTGLAPAIKTCLQEIPGRSGRVLTPA